jgi:hypothetical protein
VAEELVMQSLNRLYDRRLIEALDPNTPSIGATDKVAIKDSGLAHIELVLASPVYVEQMALVTGVNELFARDEIKRCMQKSSLNELRDALLRYVLKIDAGRVGVPKTALYAQLDMARRQVEGLVSGGKTRGQASVTARD